MFKLEWTETIVLVAFLHTEIINGKYNFFLYSFLLRSRDLSLVPALPPVFIGRLILNGTSFWKVKLECVVLGGA